MMRRLAWFALAFLAATSLAAAAAAQADPIQRSFSGNAVRLDVSAGTFRIMPSADGRIRVAVRSSDEQVSTRITVNLLGTQATVRMVGPKSGFEADIELPPGVDVTVVGDPAFAWTGKGTHELRVRGEGSSHDTGKK